jgi:hypothetical protein
MPAYDVIISATFRDMRTGIEAASQSSLKGYTQNGILYVSGLTAGKSWSIYNTSGMLMYQGIAADDKAEVPLPGRGVFIVTDGKEIIKIAQ